MIPPDPWESVPADRRLEFAVVREPLEKLIEGTILNIERALPREIANLPGGPEALRMLAHVTETMFAAIRYLCAEKPEDPARRISFTSSAAPILRSMLDALYTIVFIAEDLPSRIEWYYRAGWRELREEYERHADRYTGRADWDAWLASYRALLDGIQRDWRISANEVADPSTIPYWPTPTQMVAGGMLGHDAQTFLSYMRDWFYREFSQSDHLSLPGLIRRGSNFLRPADDIRTENTWKKLRSDTAVYAVVLTLAVVSELVLLGRFDLGRQCAYLWGVVKEYSPIAAEVYEARYETRLRR